MVWPRQRQLGANKPAEGATRSEQVIWGAGEREKLGATSWQGKQLWASRPAGEDIEGDQDSMCGQFRVSSPAGDNGGKQAGRYVCRIR